MKRKIERMHELFGVRGDKRCKDCYHLDDEVGCYKKCEVYGKSASEATDWAISWEACGLWNKPYGGDIPVVKLQRLDRKRRFNTQDQIGLFDRE